MVTKRVTVEMIRDGVVPCDCGRGHCITPMRPCCWT